MDGAYRYKAHSYHINVGQGDGAIHLLVKEEDGDAIQGDFPSRSRVVRAVLVDGGKEQKSILINPIEDIIRFIQGNYLCTLSQETNHYNTLKFDAFVVTHWDADHCNGVVSYLQTKVGTNGTSKRLRLNNAHYNGNSPLSCFIAPYFYTTNGGTNGTQRMKHLSQNHRQHIRYNGNGNGPSNFVDINSSSTKLGWAEAALKIQTGPRGVLGHNLFNNGDQNMVNKDLSTIEKLVNFNSPDTAVTGGVADPGVPGLYCIGVDGHFLTQRVLPMRDCKGGEISAESMTSSEDPEFEVATTDTNKSSISCMILWRNGHRSHYFGGDLDEDSEMTILGWAGAKANRAETHVSCMKLSHHGASTSNPIDMMLHFNPLNVVVSAGKSSYGHPRWELMALIDLWSKLRGAHQSDPSERALYLTAYPDWLEKTDDGTFRVNRKWSTAALASEEFKNKKSFRNKYLSLWEDCKKQRLFQTLTSPDNFLDEMKFKKSALSTEIRNQICKSVERRLDSLVGCLDFLKPKGIQDRGHTLQALLVVSNGNSNRKDEGVVNLVRDGKLEHKWSQDTGKPAQIYNPPYLNTRFRSQYKQYPPNINHAGNPQSLIDNESWKIIDHDQEEWMDYSQEYASVLPSTDVDPPKSKVVDNGPPYYLISELSIDPDLKIPKGEVIPIKQSYRFFNFVELLNWQIMVLDSTPQGAPGPEDYMPLGAKEGLTSWFQTMNDQKERPIEVRFSSWPLNNSTKIDFRIRFSFPQGPQIIMDTRSALSVVDVADELALDKMFAEEAIVLFGLNVSVKPFNTTLLDAVNFTGLSTEGVRFFGSGIFGAITLTLDVSTASSKARNAMWFEPAENYRTSLRLQFSAPAASDKLNTWLQGGLPGVSVSNPKVIIKRTAHYEEKANSDTLVSRGEVDITMGLKIGTIELQASLQIATDSVSLTLHNNHVGKYSLPDFLPFLENQLGLDRKDFDTWLDSAGKSDFLNRETITPRRFVISISLGEDGKFKRISNIMMSLQVLLRVGQPSQENRGVSAPVVFLLDFGWSPGNGGPYFNGSLWCNSPTPVRDDYRKALPGYEEHLDLVPLTGRDGEPVKALDLKTLMSKETVANLPSGIPTQIDEASLTLNGDGVSFTGTIVCSDPVEKNQVPRFVLDEVSVAVSYTWADKVNSLSVSLGIDVLLYPPSNVPIGSDDLELGPAQFQGTLDYDSGQKSWSLTAAFQDVTMYHIASFWVKDSRDHVMSLLKKIRIVYIDLSYEYEKKEGGSGSSFKFDGLLAVGLLQLQLVYTNSGKNDWHFSASLAPDFGDGDGKVTVKQIIESIVDDAPDGIPDAITGITFEKDKDGGKPFQLQCFEKDGYFIFIVTLKFGAVSLSFMQLRHSSWEPERPSKRIIKAAITEFPTINVDIIGKLKQPFDQLFFLWVGDKGNQKPELCGLSISEIEAINGADKISASEKLFFKLNKDKAEYKTEEVVLKRGCHFIITMNHKTPETSVLLDYAFGGDKPAKKALDHKGNELVIRSAEGADNKGSKAPLKKSMGPLSIENIGIEYNSEKKRLGIVLDATFMMGPIGLSLLGFGFDFPFDNTVNLKNPPKLEHFRPKLSGMSVAFERGPLSVAGGFKYTETPDMKVYTGGLIVNYKPWVFQAAGCYAVVRRGWPKVLTNAEDEIDNFEEMKDTYSSVFIFFKLHGPLFSVGWADISGLTGGFGVNSDINTPTVTQVIEFPFVAPDGTGKEGDSTLGTLGKLLNGVWFQPAEGKFWVAAGLKVNAFQMLSVQAVLVLQFNPGLKMGIYGVAVADVPSTKSPLKFAHVELGIVCCLDVDAGTFKVEAQLSPNSFVLHPSCHLTGGFALFSWFKDGPNAVAGDWVMTIGGYHQAFVAPPQYPRPPRLRISWSLGKNLSVTGEAYFAITPKVCMGGGRLHAALSLGPLYAYFDAYVDFLINYKPFFFQAEGGVAVGVRFTLDLWIVTIRISVEIGAKLKLRGPPMGGVVHVDFWVFGFDIEFGEPPAPTPHQTLEDFWKTALKSSSSTEGKMITSGDDVKTEEEKEKAFLFNCEAGLEPEDKKETKEGDDWLVHASNFAFTTTLKFAANEASLKDNRIADSEAQPIPIEEPYRKVFARPMQKTSTLDSTVTISVGQKPEDLHALRHISGAELMAFIADKRPWRITPIVKSMPQNIWGQYSREMDPSRSGNHVSGLLDGKGVSIPLVMGFSIRPPEPKMADDRIHKFNIVRDMKKSVVKSDNVPKLPKQEPALSAWNPKKSTIEEIKEKWESGKNDPDQVVARWAARMKFGADKKKLTGKRPTQLLSRYKDMVPAAPAICNGVAAA